jgi:hypothetical protein
MDGTFRLPLRLSFTFELADDLVDYVARAQRKSTVDENGAQPIFRNTRFERQKRSKLRVTILLDDETEVVRI